MMRAIGFALLVLTAAPGGYAAESAEVEHAKAQIASKLKDPGSAQFSKVIYVPPKENGQAGIACGWVNAKNSYGGYVGFRPFYVSKSFAEIRDDRPDGALNNHGIFDIMWSACSPFPEERFGETSLQLPTLKFAAKCEKLYTDRPEKIAGCVGIETEAKAWLESYITSPTIAYACTQAARQYSSYSMAKSCIKEREATVFFSRGPGI